jgi:hypothetical protein
MNPKSVRKHGFSKNGIGVVFWLSHNPGFMSACVRPVHSLQELFVPGQRHTRPADVEGNGSCKLIGNTWQDYGD